jgi:hypothetical protein
MELNQIKLLLLKTDKIIDDSIFEDLDRLKNQALSDNDEKLANEIWYYETVARIQSEFMSVYSLLKSDVYDNYYHSWCKLEKIEILFGQIRDNFINRVSDYHLPLIEKCTFNLQKMFPYRLFTSRECIIKSTKCSICDKTRSIRNPCEHKTGKLYKGKICAEIVVDIEFLNVSIVEHPFDKYAVLFIKGDQYNYFPLRQLAKDWNNPFDDWDMEIIKIKNPDYRQVGRNSRCSCGSGKKYKKCCLKNQTDLIDHLRITFNNQSFKETPLSVYRTMLKPE